MISTIKYLNAKVKSSKEDEVKLLKTHETLSFLKERNINFEIIEPTIIETNSYLLVNKSDLLKIA